MPSKKMALEQKIVGTTVLRLRLVAHTFSFSINTRFYTIYCSPASPPLIAASASLFLLLIPLVIVPSRLLLPLLLNWVRAIKLNHQTVHCILVAVRVGILNYCKIRQFRCKVCTRLHHSIIDFAKTNTGEGLAGPLPNFLPALVSGFALDSVFALLNFQAFRALDSGVAMMPSILKRCIPSIRASPSVFMLSWQGSLHSCG